MDDRFCPLHKQQCYLKTCSTSNNTLYAKSFYICPLWPQSCDFKTPTNLLPSMCPLHENSIVELQLLKTVKTESGITEKRNYFRCKQQKETKRNWCKFFVASNQNEKDKENTEVKTVFSVNSFYSKNRQPRGNTTDIKTMSSRNEEKRSRDDRAAKSKAPPTIVNLEKKLEWRSPNVNSRYEPQANGHFKAKLSLKSSNQFDKAMKNTEAIFQRCSGATDLKVNATRAEIKHGNNKETLHKIPFVGDAKSSGAAMMEMPTTANRNFENQNQIKKEIKCGEEKVSDVSSKDRKAFKPIESSFGERKPVMTKQKIPVGFVPSSHASAWPSTPEQKISSMEWRDRSVIKKKRTPEIKGHLVRPEYRQKMEALNQKLLFNQKLKNSVKLDSLPDKGAKIFSQIAELEKTIADLKLGTREVVVTGNSAEDCKKENMQLNVGSNKSETGRTANSTFRQTKLIDYMNEFRSKDGLQHNYAASGLQQQLYGGKMNGYRLNMVKSVTEEAVQKLHGSLQSCPSASCEVSDPSLLRTNLMTHQRQALTWLLWREKQDPPGGILADDMGLGKTLTMISLILKSKKLNAGKEESDKLSWLKKEGIVPSKTTLVICPASLLHQWAQEIEIHCQAQSLSVLIYHGSAREKRPKRIANHDVVITTYATVSREVGSSAKPEDTNSPVVQKQVLAQDSSLLHIAWERIILDEAHTIKNPKSLTNQSLCQLRAGKRWALTGTPIHNQLLDMYALLRFLRCSPFDEFKVWKKWVDNSSEQGRFRLNTLVKSLMLRRTKNQTNLNGSPLLRLPAKKAETHILKLCGKEKVVYDQLMSYSRDKMANMCHKRGEEVNTNTNKPPVRKDPENGSLFLMLLLRLQQCCGHLSLLKKAMTETYEKESDLVDQLQNLGIHEKSKPTSPSSEILKILLEFKDDLEFQESYRGTKISALLSHLESIKSASKSRQKSVIVSQWTSMLRVIGLHLKQNGYRYHLIQGDVKPEERTKAVDDFNRNPNGAEVMMLSLKAGGVGLNLVGGNHLFLVDLHWNPALEMQACDRIYRVGQKNNVFIHRFVCQATIEERILAIQDRKAQLANGILDGGSRMNKLTWEDMKLLFDLR